MTKNACRWYASHVYITYGLSTLLLFPIVECRAEEYYFAPSSLEGSQTPGDVDLSLFSNNHAQLPGIYRSTIKINKKPVDDTPLAYTNAQDGTLMPQLTPALLRKWGVRVDAYPELAALPADDPLPSAVGSYISEARADFDFNRMTLNIQMPQAAVNSQSRGGVDPSRWDDGVPALFADYALSGTETRNSNHSTSANQYLNLRTGANAGGWRLRNYSTWSNNDSEQHWENINSWIQHDIDVLKAQFTAGESSTRGEVFDSIQYNGVNIATDDDMLPYSQRGFAPTIRGTASSNAEISVRQNGYLIYQANVAPGAFEINDLYSTTNSGDLEVTVKEADGSEHSFTMPYSSLAVMQRPGHLKYEITAARYRGNNGEDVREPLFAQGSLIYGLNNDLTLLGGTTVSDDYTAFDGGVGVALGDLGAISADVTWARAQLDSGKSSRGQSWRLLYTGKLDSTDTSFTLASYRYSSRGYYSFSDANLKYAGHEDEWVFNYNKRNRIQASISQNILGSSLYLNGYQQDYWDSNKKERSLSAGLSRSFNGVSVSLSLSYNKSEDSGSDRIISLNLSVPLSRWLPDSWSSYSISNTKDGSTRQNLGVSGTLLDDQRLSYSLQQSHANHDADDSSSIYGSYRSRYANLNAGYYYSSNRAQQISYGASGGIVAHPHGITLSQPLGNQFAIISANNASDVRFLNQRGIQTDWQGNAIIPSLSAYQENTVRVDTTSLPEDIETDATAVTLVPNRNAIVSGNINARKGYRVLITLHRLDHSPVPFGAIASADEPSITGIVDEDGTLYLSGISASTHLLVKWGSESDRQCRAFLALDLLAEKSHNPAGIRLVNLLCH